jgi:hypothetical protein
MSAVQRLNFNRRPLYIYRVVRFYIGHMEYWCCSSFNCGVALGPTSQSYGIEGRNTIVYSRWASHSSDSVRLNKASRE